MDPSPARPGEVDVTEAYRLAEAGEVLLLDVREPYEWAAGRAGQAVHVPLGQLHPAGVPRDRPVVAVCRVGGRSEHAAHLLAAAGHEVRNMVGGMTAWSAHGLPVVADGGRPGSVI